jgi:hypothetical protein
MKHDITIVYRVRATRVRNADTQCGDAIRVENCSLQDSFGIEIVAVAICRVRAGVQRLASVSASRGRDMLRRRKCTSVARRHITQGAALSPSGSL